MQPVLPHQWDLSEKMAWDLQVRLSRLVRLEDCLPEPIRRVAGVDAAYQDGGSRAFAGIAVVDLRSGQPEEVVSAEGEVAFPYIPGLLSFREVPILVAAFAKLSVKPDLVICDGQGTAHPRRFGIACHIGVIYDVPSIGCAKTRLIGEAAEPNHKRGSFTNLVSGGEIIGAVLRTRDSVKPMYVSPGHRVSLSTACNLVLHLCSQYRIPDPIRMADQAVNRLKRGAVQTSS